MTKTGGAYSYGATSDEISSDPQANGYTFDQNGNEITKGGWIYEYDYDNQLKNATAPNGKIIEFWYDPDGNRIRKSVTVSGTTTTTGYVVDALQPYAQVLIETDGNGAVVAKYAYGDDLLKVSRSGEYYYFYDGLGSTRVITDTSGAVKNRYTYDAFGNGIAGETEEVVTNEYLFAGQRIDKDTGLIYLRARYCDPANGRFLQIDALFGRVAEPQTLHRYAYAANNPALHTDPGGQDFSLTGVMASIAIRVSMAARWASVAFQVYSKVSDAVSLYNIIVKVAEGQPLDLDNWLTIAQLSLPVAFKGYKQFFKRADEVAEAYEEVTNFTKLFKELRRKARDLFAKSLNGRVLPGEYEVHHVIELQVLKNYPGAFAAAELNDIERLVCIPATRKANLLHRSDVRVFWNRVYGEIDAVKDQLSPLQIRERLLLAAEKCEEKFNLKGLIDNPEYWKPP